MSETGASEGKRAAIEGVTPILSVQNLAVSIDYYVRILGFVLDWEDPGIMASVSRDGCSLMLCHGDQGNPGTWVWIGVDDVYPLFTEVSGKGAVIRHPPTNYWWAYEMQIQDPDGHVLRFGSESREDLPFGEWLDMRGNRWRRTPDGTWTQSDSADS